MKSIVVIGDGMADWPLDELGGKTPLMVAKKPHMDFMASRGFTGKVLTVPQGFSPASDVACMSIFGYDPSKYYTGRAPIEAYAMGIRMDEADVVFRCNLVYLDVRLPTVVMGDYSAGHITTDEARSLVSDLQSTFGNEQFRFYPGVSYRHILVWKGGKTGMETTPPHDILEKEVIDHMPRGEGAETIVKLMSDSQLLLKDHPVNRARLARSSFPANSIWLWGQGRKPYFPAFREKYGASGAVVAAVDLVKGIGALAGFDTPHIEGATGYLDTDYGAKARAALELLDGHDVVYVHIEAPDEASHGGMTAEKIRAIERIDHDVLGFLLENTGEKVQFLLATDHATPIALRTHYATPVPFAMFGKGGRWSGGAATYDENAGDSVVSGEEMVTRFLKGVNR